MSKIISLTVENIKRIKAVHITPEGSSVILTGKNGNGKSSTMDAIEMAFSGKKKIPEKPVRFGEETARIIIDTEDKKITRWWTNPETSYIKVEIKGAGTMAKPQDILNEMVGNLSFDPLEFTTMDASKRLKLLKEITKLDFTALDSEYKTKFADRTNVKRDIGTYEGILNGMDPDELDPDVNVEDLKTEREAMALENRQIETARRQIADCQKFISEGEASITRISEKIESLKREMDDLHEQNAKARKSIQADEETAALDLTNLQELDAKIANYEGNKKIILQKKNTQAEIAKAKKLHQDLNSRLKEIDDLKEDMIAKADMPIKGLSFGDGEILFNKVPFIQLSTGEQIRISMSIAMALNPKLRVVMIKNGSLLDADALAEVNRMAEEGDFQVWIEKVADTPDGNSIFIQDGEVLS